MSSINSYLIRAWVDWMEDNGMSAHLVVATNISGVDVPFEFAKDNQIVLCIDSEAVTNLLITTSGISFNASFNGVSRVCAFPIHAVRAVYDIDSGRGTMLPEMEAPNADEEETGSPASSSSSSFMKIVK